jgi:chromosome segregation ATPase
MIEKPKSEPKTDKSQVFGEVKRFAHQVKALTEFADSVNSLADVEQQEKETRGRLDKLKAEEAQINEKLEGLRQDAKGRFQAAVEAVDDARIEADKIVKDAKANAEEIKGKASADAENAARLMMDRITKNRDTIKDEITEAEARLKQVQAEVKDFSKTRDELKEEVGRLRARFA